MGNNKISRAIRKIVFPLPEDQKKQGFEPNFYITFLRRIAKLMIFLGRLNGKNRFSNEFIQMLDPKLTVKLPVNESLTFRTGHGRLLWRAKTFQQEEPMIIDWIHQFDDNDVFFDVGANVGSYSIYAAKKGIKTFAFEPEYLNLSLLYENIFLNHLEEKCTPFPIALSDITQMDVFYLKSISRGDALHSIGRKSYALENPDNSNYKLNTPVITLDDAVKMFNLPKPTRLKIDVDFNELRVINGAVKTLETVQELYIEIDNSLEEHVEALKILKEMSFEVIKKESIGRTWNNEIFNYLLRKRGIS